ncbi:MAG: hypothetical protein U0528_15780 [Anaerolineae bacterium]|nr:hypothetical protein [Anaerolineae bacterium]
MSNIAVKQLNWQKWLAIAVLTVLLIYSIVEFLKVAFDGIADARTPSEKIASVYKELISYPTIWAHEMVKSSKSAISVFGSEYAYEPMSPIRVAIKSDWQQILENYVWRIPWTVSADDIDKYTVDFYAMDRAKRIDEKEHYYSIHQSISIIRGIPNVTKIYCAVSGNMCVITDTWKEDVSEVAYAYPSTDAVSVDSPCLSATVTAELWWVDDTWKLVTTPRYACTR